MRARAAIFSLNGRFVVEGESPQDLALRIRQGKGIDPTMGLYAALQITRRARGAEPLPAPPTTMMGALARYITWPETTKLQPMKAVWGILPVAEGTKRDKESRRAQAAQTALREMTQWATALGEAWTPPDQLIPEARKTAAL